MKYFTLIAFALLIFACGNPASEQAAVEDTEVIIASEYKKLAEAPDIKIQVEGLTGGVVSLIGTFQDQQYRADSTLVDGSGQIVFKRNEAYQPGHYFVLLPDGQNSLQVLIDLDQTFTMKTKMASLITAMQVEGSVENDLLYQTLRFEEDQRVKFQMNSQQMSGMQPNSPDYLRLKKEQDKLLDDRNAFLNGMFEKNPKTLFTKFKRGGQNPDLRNVTKPDGSLDTARYGYLYRRQFWDGVDFNDERLMWTPVIGNKLKKYIKELTPQQPDSIKAYASFLVDKSLGKKEYYKYFANWITLQYDPKESKVMDSEAIFVHMIQNYFTYDRAFWSDSVEVHGLQLRAHEMAGSLLGNKGPDVISKDPAGQTRSIYEMKAPYIVVYMYNPDCEHCLVETPKLVQLYKEWKSKGMEVFGIAIDTDDAKWKAYIAKNGLTWTNVHDPTNKSIYAKYFVDVTPEIYVLNPDRTLVGKNLHVDQITTIIERDMRKRGKS